MDCILQCLGWNGSLKVGNETYSIVRLLGDGGYAFVYLVRQQSSQELFALKKIRCMFGGESVANAMREIDACKLLSKSGKVVPCVDSSIVQEPDGSKTVYLVMPYYEAGTLQDRIEETKAGEPFSEQQVREFGLGVADAIAAMHGYRSLRNSESEILEGERDALLDSEMDELVRYAHRDIKPANVMFDSKGHARLIDLGSCSPARVDVNTRQDAVQLQDLAAEHCTLPFRAPELFDVRTGARIDESVDIWSFGCTLFNVMYGISPFEREEQVSGGNINISIARAIFSFPQQPEYSQYLKDIISACLQPIPSDRPTIIELKEWLAH